MGVPRSTAIENFRNQQQARNQQIVTNEEVTWKQIILTFGPLVLMAGGMLIVMGILFPVLFIILFG